MTQALYAHINNKTIKKKRNEKNKTCPERGRAPKAMELNKYLTIAL
jgi:hypothetical protein